VSTPNEQDEAFVALPDLALGMVPAAEAARLMAIVNSSEKLRNELASLRGAANVLALAAPAVPMAADRKSAMRDRLMARAAASTTADATGATETRQPRTIATPASSPALQLEPRESRHTPIIREVQVPARLSLVQRLSPFLALAAAAGLVVSIFQLQEMRQQRNDVEAALRVATASATQMTNKLAISDSLVAAMSGANVRVVNMVSTLKQAPGAKMFWDLLANRWTLITHDLPSVKEGRTYQLWLVTAKAEKISAGTFNTDASGRAVVQATYPLSEADLAAIAITEEPVGGSAQPTGTILVAGAATR
jgi:Anti-sigma-K factor rskA